MTTKKDLEKAKKALAKAKDKAKRDAKKAKENTRKQVKAAKAKAVKAVKKAEAGVEAGAKAGAKAVTAKVAEVKSALNPTPLADRTVRTLRAQAKDQGVPGYSRMTKEALLQKLS
jgi:hypothetical protein